MTKRCTRCQQVLPATPEFFCKHSGGLEGLQSRCKRCQAAIQHAWYEKNRKLVRVKHHEYYQKNRKRLLAQQRNHYATDPVRRNGMLEYQRKRGLREFGITSEEYGAMLASQGGMCAICGREPNGRRLAVEHDHKTGKIRGLVCVWCNSTVAWVEHNPQALGALERYLEKAGAMK